MDQHRANQVYMQARNITYRKAKRSNNPNHWMYTKGNETKSQMSWNMQKRISLTHLIHQTQNWKVTKIVTKKESRIPVIKSENGDLISDDYQKAEALNTFFSKCFNTCVPPLTDNDRELFANTSSYCCSELLCTEDEILELLLFRYHQDKWSGWHLSCYA